MRGGRRGREGEVERDMFNKQKTGKCNKKKTRLRRRRRGKRRRRRG